MAGQRLSGVTRRELLKWVGASGIGLALTACGASATPTPKPAAGGAPANLSGSINYWHHFTSDSEMKGLERITSSFKTK